MTEERLWKKLKEVWPGHAVRVEASMGGVDPGTPDGNISVGGKGGWIELKVWPTPLNPVQRAWHVDAIQRGAMVRVVCWVDGVGVWVGVQSGYDHLINRGVKPLPYMCFKNVGSAAMQLMDLLS